MHDRVTTLALLIVAIENAGGVGHGQNFGDVVHTPGQRYGQISQRDKAEQVSQDPDGVGDVVEGGAAVEALPGPGAGSEQSVGNGLGEQIGEILAGQGTNEVGLEGFKESREHTRRVLFLVKLLGNHFPQEARSFGQFDGERCGRERPGQPKIEVAVQERVEFIRPFNGRRQAQLVEHQGPGSQDSLLALAVPVQTELEKVSENEIRKSGAVALELLGILDQVQTLFRRFLGLNVADDAVLAVPKAEIRVSALGGLGKCGDVYVRSCRFLWLCLPAFSRVPDRNSPPEHRLDRTMAARVFEVG